MSRHDLLSGHHVNFSLCAHVVFVTKFRKRVLTTPILELLYVELTEKSRNINVNIREIKGEVDHIHFLLEYKPTDRLSSIVGTLKSHSSSATHKSFTLPYYGNRVRTLWSSGYFVGSCGGVTVDVLKAYISNHQDGLANPD